MHGVGAGPAALCPALLGGSRVPGGGHSYLWVLGASTPNTQPEMGLPCTGRGVGSRSVVGLSWPRGSWGSSWGALKAEREGLGPPTHHL